MNRNRVIMPVVAIIFIVLNSSMSDAQMSVDARFEQGRLHLERGMSEIKKVHQLKLNELPVPPEGFLENLIIFGPAPNKWDVDLNNRYGLSPEQLAAYAALVEMYRDNPLLEQVLNPKARKYTCDQRYFMLDQRIFPQVLSPPPNHEVFLIPSTKKSEEIIYRWKSGLFDPDSETARVCIRPAGIKGSGCSEKDGAIVLVSDQQIGEEVIVKGSLPLELQGKKLEWGVARCPDGKDCSLYQDCNGPKVRSLLFKLSPPELVGPVDGIDGRTGLSNLVFSWKKGNTSENTHWKILGETSAFDNTTKIYTGQIPTKQPVRISQWQQSSGQESSMNPQAQRSIIERGLDEALEEAEPRRQGGTRAGQSIYNQMRTIEFNATDQWLNGKNPLDVFWGPLTWKVGACNDEVDCTWSETRSVTFPVNANVCIPKEKGGVANPNNGALVALELISPHGDKLGFWENEKRPPGRDQEPPRHNEYTAPRDFLEKDSHMQGIQRLRGTNNFVVTASTEIVEVPTAQRLAGYFYIAKLASRPEKGRLRSNRISREAPHEEDELILRKTLELIPNSSNQQPGQLNQDGRRLTTDNTYYHPGGLQAIGDYVAMGVGNGDSEEPERVVFYDMKEPLTPRKLPYEVLVPRADAVAITKLLDGRYLMLVRGGNNDPLIFFRSTNANLEDPQFEEIHEWEPSQLLDVKGEGHWRNYQNLNFVRTCEGEVFLLGFHRNAGRVYGYEIDPLDGADWIDPFHVGNLQSGLPTLKVVGEAKTYDVMVTDEYGEPTEETFETRVSEQGYPIYCRNLCAFSAGGGAYIAEGGELLIYGVEHFIHNQKLRLNENRFVSPVPITDIDQAWVQMFRYKNFEIRGEGRKIVRALKRVGQILGRGLLIAGLLVAAPIDRIVESIDFTNSLDLELSRTLLGAAGASREKIRQHRQSGDDASILVDYKDRTLRNYSDFRTFEHFDDRPSAISWQIPKGWGYALYEGVDFKSDLLLLEGQGEIAALPNLRELERVGGMTESFDNSLSSGHFLKLHISEIEEGWIELFEHPKFEGRRLTICGGSEFVTTNRKCNASIQHRPKDFARLEVEGTTGFAEKVSSVRYHLPPFTTYRLYARTDHETDQESLDLVGNGEIQEIRDFRHDTIDFDNKVQSSQLIN